MCAALLGAGPSHGQGVVHCLDEARGTVRDATADQCRGRIISADEARRLRDARDERINRIVRGSDRPPATRELPQGTVVRRRSGTGFFIAADGTLLTNRHVAGGCRALSVTLGDGRTVPAELRAVAQDDDIALLHASVTATAFARFTNNPDLTSEKLVIVGYPANLPTPRVATMATAQRSTADLLIGQRFYAVPGSVRPGNSGSPVLDQAGNVVGMVVASIRPREVAATAPPTPGERVAAIPNATVVGFLAQHHVGVAMAPPAREFTDAELLGLARRFVARVNCEL